ncbi:hypothetical protein BJ508DRAFT_103499 [Ascobolus immersus RN42]|uniref:Uncharacterized protein n=1 Tax=Ascobolus immersus RN42 TaxID=1160509 RepID=A0A3N4H959_ASCIM|nr:hypothetical protein BJ508DRAFT_103499 [Ascobolus immersus RN42]
MVVVELTLCWVGAHVADESHHLLELLYFTVSVENSLAVLAFLWYAFCCYIYRGLVLFRSLSVLLMALG